MVKPLRSTARSAAAAERASKTMATEQTIALKIRAALSLVDFICHTANRLTPTIPMFSLRRGRDALATAGKMPALPLSCDYRFDRFAVQHVLDGRGHATFSIGPGQRPAAVAQLLRRISHDKGLSGESQHFDIVVVITNGHDLLAGNTAVVHPTFECVSLGTAGVEHVDDRKIAPRILRAQDSDGEGAARENSEGLLHMGDRAAEHGLHGIGGQRLFDRHHRSEEHTSEL